MNDGTYSREALNYTIESVYRHLISQKSIKADPVAFVLGGQPGAGKTGLQDIMKAQCDGNLIVINGDEFRELHPNYQILQEKYGKDSVDYTNDFSGKVTEALLSRLRDEKYNVLVEGTLRTAEIPLSTCKGFKDNGYNVTLGLIAVKPEISYLSTILRYEKQLAAGKQPRATAKDKHDYVVEHLPSNLSKIYDSKKFDNIVIYNREGICLYDMEKANTTSPQIVIQDVLQGKWSQQELDQFIAIGNITQQLMEQRNAAEIDVFKANIFNNKVILEIAQSNSLNFPKPVLEPKIDSPEQSTKRASMFSRAAQKSFVEKSAERPQYSNKNKNDIEH
ncbi:MAG: zeta toxin family protein [Ruminococcus sp.]|nr:zeta toxin family protein [Ruminococcus sp.]MBR6622534.1 zeta toxin family protein [Ruminococcus sp.]